LHANGDVAEAGYETAFPGTAPRPRPARFLRAARRGTRTRFRGRGVRRQGRPQVPARRAALAAPSRRFSPLVHARPVSPGAPPRLASPLPAVPAGCRLAPPSPAPRASLPPLTVLLA